MPNVPLKVRVSRAQLSAPYRLSVSWDPPDNSNKFDLDHFKVHIMLPDLEQVSYIANGTSMEPEYHFHSESVMVPPQNRIHIAVIVVSKCSQQSLSGPLAIELGWREVTEKTVFTNALDVVNKTDNGPIEYKDITITNGNNLKLISKPHILFPS